jgi:hypothetical protein
MVVTENYVKNMLKHLKPGIVVSATIHPPRWILLSPRRRAAKKLWSTPIRKWGNSLPIRRDGPGQALDKGVRGISTRKAGKKLWSASIRRGGQADRRTYYFLWIDSLNFYFVYFDYT